MCSTKIRLSKQVFLSKESLVWKDYRVYVKIIKDLTFNILTSPRTSIIDVTNSGTYENKIILILN